MPDHDHFFDPSSETPLREEFSRDTNSDPRCGQAPWKPGDELGPFVLESLLGSGSSGWVFRAKDPKTGRRTALKLLRKEDPDQLVRNRLGFRKMTPIEHPNLMRLGRIYQFGSYTALEMEEIEGVTFAKAIRTFKKLPEPEAFQRLLGCLRDYATGLAMIHAHGLVHRDIKPQNLMVDSQGRGRVIDYGLVDQFDVDGKVTSGDGFILGTPRYMAPDVLIHQRYLPAGDVFSLGIVIVEVLRWMISPIGDDASLIRRDREDATDAELISESIDGLPNSVPGMILEACREMLSRDAADRPTAMSLARLGLPPRAIIPLTCDEPLIGRDDEFAKICAWAHSIKNGATSRLSITGPSGIGKTRLLDELIKYIESGNWSQVFRGRCRLREDSALQAFEQICDAIAHRYMREDREKVELDPVSHEILCSVFPVLRNTIRGCLDLPPAGTSTTRLDSLEAAVRFTEQLRLIGPLFIVIDDSQWADQDSLNVLDRLQTAVGQKGLGVITVSRLGEDPQRVPPDERVEVKPIGRDSLVDYLTRTAERWCVPLAADAIERLADSTEGNPFRLRELAAEFRPGGAIAEIGNDLDDPSLLSLLGTVGGLAQKRFDRLSDDAKSVLLYVVTAGGRVSTEQLCELTGLGDEVEAAVSELTHHRLVQDEATGGDCIFVVHDRIADLLTSQLSDQAKRKANGAWASYLVRQDNPQALAARIAGHWFAAGQPGRAVSHAILAAEDAERRMAHTEAGRWHALVIDHVSGNEKIHRIRQAARCYDDADFPVEAARYYQQLSELVDRDQQVECQLMASVMLLRSGRFSMVREQLAQLTGTLGLPRPKPQWLTKLCLMSRSLQASVRRKSLVESLTKEIQQCGDNRMAERHSPAATPEEVRNRQRFQLCVSIVRPMSLFDTYYAAELSMAASSLARRFGNQAQRVHVAVGEAVFSSYNSGPKRTEAGRQLMELKEVVNKMNSSHAKGDVWTGIAYSHGLSCRWAHVSMPVDVGVGFYQEVEHSHGFEIAHVRWLDLMANWNVGRWKRMMEVSDEMFADALRRNDLFQQLVTIEGFGCGVWLARDRVEDLDRIHRQNHESLEHNATEVFHLFDRITEVLCSTYQGHIDRAWSDYQELAKLGLRMPFSQVQLFRVLCRSLGSLIALHRYAESPCRNREFESRKLTRELRREQIGYCSVLADLHEGLLEKKKSQLSGHKDGAERAKELLSRAQTAAAPDRLRPYEMAAADALAEIKTGRRLGLLRERMAKQGIVVPHKFSRLYTVDTEDPAS